jgi:hypothetical protein
MRPNTALGERQMPVNWLKMVKTRKQDCPLRLYTVTTKTVGRAACRYRSNGF